MGRSGALTPPRRRPVANAVNRSWICRWGAPLALHTDCGSNFDSRLFQEVCRTLDVNKTRTTPYHPEGNGLVERTNRTLHNLLLAFCKDSHEHDWDTQLPFCLMAYRSSTHASTGFTPHYLWTGRELRLPVDLQHPLDAPDPTTVTTYASQLRETIRTAYNAAREVLSLARDVVSQNSLEIVEASIVGKFKFFLDGRVELSIDSFRHTSCSASQEVPILSDEILIPFFLFRGAPSNVLSSETLNTKLRNVWQKACSPKSSLRLSDYLLLWATAGLDMSVPFVQDKRELSWFNISAVLPNAPFFLRKIRSYPFDADYLRFCLQTELAVEKFKHLDPLNSNGEFCNYRFGFFLMDSSGCLVPYLDGDPILESSTIAGVWCSGVGEASIHTWLALFRYAFFQGRVDAHRRVFCTAPVLAVHDRPTNRVSFYSVHCETREHVVTKQPTVFTREQLSGSRVCLHFSPLESGYTYADLLEFHMLAGCGSLKAFSGPSRTTSNAFTLRLEPLNTANHATLRADFSRFADAVATLAADLGCKISSSSSVKLPVSKSATAKSVQSSRTRAVVQPTQPVLVKATPPGSQKSHVAGKRSVKFDLPPKTSTVACEVPEVSLLVEEGVCTDSPRSPRKPVSVDALPRNPPFTPVPSRPFRPPLLKYHPQRLPSPRLFPAFSTPQRYAYDPARYYSPPVMPACYLPPAPPQRPSLVQPVPPQTDQIVSTPVCDSSTGAGPQEGSNASSLERSREDFARLEMLIEKLLAWHKDLENSRTPSTSASTAMTASVGTNTTALWPPAASTTSAALVSPREENGECSHTSVAVNTSLHWPTLSSIGLLPESPRRCESTATQCSQALDRPATSAELFENGYQHIGASDHSPSRTTASGICNSRQASERSSNSQSPPPPPPPPTLLEGQFWPAASTAAPTSVLSTPLLTQYSPNTANLAGSSDGPPSHCRLAENSTASSSAQQKLSCQSTDCHYQGRQEEEEEPSCTRLMAELQQVLTAQRSTSAFPGDATADVLGQAALGKAHSEPTFAAAPSAPSAVQPNFVDHPTLDADYEEELAKQRQLCEEAAVLLLSQLDSSSYLSTPNGSPLKALLDATDSRSFAQSRTSSSSRRKSNYTNTDESAILAGLVKKYLSPTMIQKLTCGDHSTAATTSTAFSHSSFANSEADFGLPDVSMATRRYMEHHNLLGDRRKGRDCRGGSCRLQMASTPAVSELVPAAEFSTSISTLTPAATECCQNPTSGCEAESSLDPWPILRPSELFPRQPSRGSDNPDADSVESVLGPSYDHALSQTGGLPASPLSNSALDESCSRILDLEHLRTLPKLL
ncbi:hypothetical protein SprV_0501899600 [Sparganum proliferum]